MGEVKKIDEVIDTYLKGMRTGKVQHWRKAFWPDCIVINANEEDVEKSKTPIADYAAFIKEQHDKGIPCEEFPVDREISFIGNIANVKLKWRFVLGDQTLFGTTFFNLVKRKERWKVSQKIYYVTG